MTTLVQSLFFHEKLIKISRTAELICQLFFSSCESFEKTKQNKTKTSKQTNKQNGKVKDNVVTWNMVSDNTILE